MLLLRLLKERTWKADAYLPRYLPASLEKPGSVSEVVPDELGSGLYSLQGLVYFTKLGALTDKHRLVSLKQD